MAALDVARRRPGQEAAPERLPDHPALACGECLGLRAILRRAAEALDCALDSEPGERIAILLDVTELLDRVLQ